MVDSVVCLTVYYKKFSVSAKKSIFSKKENLVVCYILFSVALNSGFFFVSSSYCPRKRVVWGSADKKVYNYTEFDLWKGAYVSWYFYQYASHQCLSHSAV